MVLFFLTVFDNMETFYYARNLDIFCLVKEYTTSSLELVNFSLKGILFPPVNIHYLNLFGKNNLILILVNLSLELL